jgi:hypothetical protein
MAATNDTQGGDSFDSPGTGKGPTESASPLSQRNDGADPRNVNSGRGQSEGILKSSNDTHYESGGR